jgi:cytochrome c553
MPLKIRIIFPCILLLLLLACQPKRHFDPELHFKENCTICHENKEMQRGPNLFGLDSDYLESQMWAFKNGIRGGSSKNKSAFLMGSVKSNLPPKDQMPILAKWMEKQLPLEKVYNLKGDAAAGKELAQACLTCHNQKGPYPVPDLLSLEPWYLLDQLRKFKSGLRGSNPNDAAGALMKASVTGLSDRDLKKIVLYLQSQMQQNSK